MTLPAPRRTAAVMVAAAAALLVGLLGGAAPASAHPLSTTAVLLDVSSTQVSATVQLPIDRLAIARGTDLRPTNALDGSVLPGLRTYVQKHLSASAATGPTWATSVDGGTVRTIDGVPHLVLNAVLTPPAGPVGAFTLTYDAILEQLVPHRVFISIRSAGEDGYTSLGVLDWRQQAVAVPAPDDAATTNSFGSSVWLGLHHIAEGSDHVLFLLMLLVPAPLSVAGRRWVRRPDVRRAVWRTVHVVTAFAVGHSLTLALGAAGLVQLPVRLVESGIALSVLVSAVHAVRPLVRGGEVLIAVGFGLLHGLAFATLLDQLELTTGNLVANLLGFNLGVEITQLLVVALVMPSLLLLSRTRAYGAVRVALGEIGIVLSTAWLAERTGLLSGNLLGPVANQLVEHPFLAAGTLALAATLAARTPALRTDQPDAPHPAVDLEPVQG